MSGHTATHLSSQLASLHKRAITTNNPSYWLSERELEYFYSLVLKRKDATVSVRFSEDGRPTAFACGFANLPSFNRNLSVFLLPIALRAPTSIWRLIKSSGLGFLKGMAARRGRGTPKEHLGMIVADRQGSSFATAQLLSCVADVYGWLRANGATQVRASTHEENASALSLLRALGFRPLSVHRRVVELERQL